MPVARRPLFLALSLPLFASLGCASGGVLDTEGDPGASPLTASLSISEVQTRGTNGGDDEFVELYNAGDTPVVLDGTWWVSARSAVGACASNAETKRFAAVGTVPAHGHLLATGKRYDGAVAGDATYTIGIPDAASVVLRHGTEVVDAVCFGYDAATRAALAGCTVPYTCGGDVADNAPHDNTTHAASNADVSLQRAPGAAAFVGAQASTPEDLASAPPGGSPAPLDACPVPTTQFSVLESPSQPFGAPTWFARLYQPSPGDFRALASVNSSVAIFTPVSGALVEGTWFSNVPTGRGLLPDALAVTDGPDFCTAVDVDEQGSTHDQYVYVACPFSIGSQTVAENTQWTSIAIADLGATKVVVGTDAQGLHAVDVDAHGASGAVVVDPLGSGKAKAIVAADGVIHVVYEANDKGYVYVRHAQRRDGVWSVATLGWSPGAPRPASHNVALARTPEGAPVALFMVPGNNAVELAEWTGAAFGPAVTLDWAGTPLADVGLAVDCAGRRRVAYTRYQLTDNDSGNSPSHLRLGYIDASGALIGGWAWFNPARLVAPGFAYAVDAAGHEHIAVADGATAGHLSYATR